MFVFYEIDARIEHSQGGRHATYEQKALNYDLGVGDKKN
jgi:hypothetical protein